MLRPPAEVVPTVKWPPARLFTCHVSAVLPVPVTVAVNCRVAFTATLAIDGATVKLIAGAAVTVTVADPVLVQSAEEIVVTVTARNTLDASVQSGLGGG